MSEDSRTFKVTSPPMKGPDIEAWQEWLNHQMDLWRVEYQIKTDGFYGVRTRDLTASVCHGLGMTASDALASGLGPELRTKLRHKRLTSEEVSLSRARKQQWLPRFRERFIRWHLSTPTPVIITHDWGYHPGIHDGVDLIAPWGNPMLAICDGVIVRADADGWWGNNPKPSPGHPVSDGDGIIIIECAVSIGPFKPGMHFCYGHGEYAAVSVGQRIRAGQVIGKVGWANAPHIHFMVNDIRPVDDFYTGRGDRDPWPFVDYAIRNA